jgi:hypothetical protein
MSYLQSLSNDEIFNHISNHEFIYRYGRCLGYAEFSIRMNMFYNQYPNATELEKTRAILLLNNEINIKFPLPKDTAHEIKQVNEPISKSNIEIKQANEPPVKTNDQIKAIRALQIQKQQEDLLEWQKKQEELKKDKCRIQ